MLIAIDANFRLKRRAVSSNERDPALGSGWGYFVEDLPYREHVLKHADQDDVSFPGPSSAAFNADDGITDFELYRLRGDLASKQQIQQGLRCDRYR